MNLALIFLALFLPLGLPRGGAENPRSYEAPQATRAITIDGILDDPDWATASWTEDFVDILGNDSPIPPLRTRAKLVWDQEHLFVAAELEEPHLWATLLERDAIIYRDDDFEVFLDPDGDGLDYFEIEVNALGSVLDLFMNKPYSRGGTAEVGWDVLGLRVAVSLTGTLNDPSDLDGGWTVEMAVPWTDLAPPGIPPEPGDLWRINLSRVDWPLDISGGSYRKTAEPSREHRHPESNWVWSPQGAVDMHLPERWGVVRFLLRPQNAPSENSP